jgi:hypothetical protein
MPLSRSDTFNDLQGPKERQHLVVIEEELEMKAMREEQSHYQHILLVTYCGWA